MRARPPCRCRRARAAARYPTDQLQCARSAVPAGDSPICSDMALQMLLYFHVYFSVVWFAMYWYLWAWKVSVSCFVLLSDFLSGCLRRHCAGLRVLGGTMGAEPAAHACDCAG